MDTAEASRIKLGASPDTSPEQLRALARDPSIRVRASLAFNPSLPPEIGALLATDNDPRVRAILLRGQAGMKRYGAVENLAAMIADASLKARARIADAVQELPDGPRDIVLRLAHDPVLSVCDKVIRFSPVLTEDDLLELIATEPPQTSIAAVASRKDIGETVSDAVAAVGDAASITALLLNVTAVIRDPTLDGLAARAEEHIAWHSPFVHRPRLPPRSQRLLADIVTDDLRTVLASRRDALPEIARASRGALGPSGSAGRDDLMLDALHRRDVVGATAMLATRTGLPIAVIERACRTGVPGVLLSLTWKAGFSPAVAVGVQIILGHVAVSQVLKPDPAGEFPLTQDEMRSQLSFLGIAEPARQSKQAWIPRRLG